MSTQLRTRLAYSAAALATAGGLAASALTFAPIPMASAAITPPGVSVSVGPSGDRLLLSVVESTVAGRVTRLFETTAPPSAGSRRDRLGSASMSSTCSDDRPRRPTGPMSAQSPGASSSTRPSPPPSSATRPSPIRTTSQGPGSTTKSSTSSPGATPTQARSSTRATSCPTSERLGLPWRRRAGLPVQGPVQRHPEVLHRQRGLTGSQRRSFVALSWSGLWRRDTQSTVGTSHGPSGEIDEDRPHDLWPPPYHCRPAPTAAWCPQPCWPGPHRRRRRPPRPTD